MSVFHIGMALRGSVPWYRVDQSGQGGDTPPPGLELAPTKFDGRPRDIQVLPGMVDMHPNAVESEERLSPSSGDRDSPVDSCRSTPDAASAFDVEPSVFSEPDRLPRDEVGPPPTGPRDRQQWVQRVQDRAVERLGAAQKVQGCKALGWVMRALKVGLASFDLASAFLLTFVTLGLTYPALVVAGKNLEHAAWGSDGATVAAAAPAQALDDPAGPRAGGGEPGPSGAVFSDPAQRLVQALETARRRMTQAVEQADVEVSARKGFMRRALMAGAGLVTVGTSLALTVLTGGAPLAAVGLVVAVMVFRNLVANVACARENLRRAKAGEPLLPMGNNALNNAMYQHLISQPDVSEAKARLRAARAGAFATVLIGVTQLSLAVMPLAGLSAAPKAIVAVKHAIKSLRIFASGTRGLVNAHDFSQSRAQRKERDARHIHAIRTAAGAWKNFLSDLQPAPGLSGRQPRANLDQKHGLPHDSPARGRLPAFKEEALDDIARTLAIWSMSGLPAGVLEGTLRLMDGQSGLSHLKDALALAQKAVDDQYHKGAAAIYVDGALTASLTLSATSWLFSAGKFAEDLASA